MIKKIEANQSRPYEVMKNSLFNKNQLRDFLAIAQKNQPNLSIEEIVEMFKKLSNTGCSSAMLANTIANQLYEDDEEFKEKFGFSLYISGTNKIDYNKLMVDVFSRLYNVGKIKLIEYDRYKYETAIEASKDLFDMQFKTEAEAMMALFENGIAGNGYSEDGNKLFISRTPKIKEYIGTYNEVAAKKFKVENIYNQEDFLKLCKENQVEAQFKDFEIYQKLTGLSTNNFNFWCDYYFNSHKLDMTFISERINFSDFSNDYEEFQKYMLDLISNGYSISIAAGPNTDVSMHNNKPMSWMKISNESAGHVMSFKGFNKNNDILVSSYGIDYIIPKEYISTLEVSKIYKEEVVREKEETVSRRR